jgi:signal transduction histidine kinase
MKITEQALSIAEKTGNAGMIASYYGLFGFIYLREGNFGVAKKYYTRYFNLSMQLKDSLALADAYCCLGDVYAGLRQQGNALGSFFKARHIYSNLANFYSFQPPPGAETKQKERLAYTFNKISGAYFLNGNYVTALQYADSVFTYANATICNMYDLAAYYINTGNIYNHLKNYPAALLMLNNGAAISKKISHRENMRDAYAALAETYAGLHRYDSAYAFATLAALLKDSIVNEESIAKIAAVQSQYDSEKRDEATAQQNFVRNLLVVALLVGIAILSLLYSRYLLKQKNKYQAQANKQQSELFNAVVSAQDKERKRIAQDIHDSLGSMLSAAKLNLTGLEVDKMHVTNAQREKYETVLALLDDASSELRHISQNLMPATLLKLGLVAALQNLLERISANGLRIHFAVHDVKTRLDETMEISIYRIVLELVNNIVKHSAAEEATVQIIRYPSYLNITIEDNGRGFDYTQASAGTKGMGLGNILSRIEYLKGTMEVDSGKGTGTTVIIDIPLGSDTTGLV